MLTFIKKFITLISTCYFFSLNCISQPIDSIVTLSKAATLVKALASDSLEGRGNFSNGQLLAADLIANQFQKAGLQPWVNCYSYYQSFHVSGKLVKSIDVELNGRILKEKEFKWLSPCLYVAREQSLKFTVNRIANLTELQDFLVAHQMDTAHQLVLFESANRNTWNKIDDYITYPVRAKTLIVHITQPIDQIELVLRPSLPEEALLFNIIGVLPGKSRADEIVIISSHYDHEGIKGDGADRIFNGANDNASGTTAVMLLADYFGRVKQNERTLVFCCFAGEEMGLKGSKDFSKWINPEKITAVINIEMIGRKEAALKNKIFITGAEKTNLIAILNKPFLPAQQRFVKDPHQSSFLFSRSDNFPFAELGIPSHTVMTSSDKDMYYHTAGDEVSTLNLIHMTATIQLIAHAINGIVNGTETPSRIGKPW
jgi:Peptidase family M28